MVPTHAGGPFILISNKETLDDLESRSTTNLDRPNNRIPSTFFTFRSALWDYAGEYEARYRGEVSGKEIREGSAGDKEFWRALLRIHVKVGKQKGAHTTREWGFRTTEVGQMMEEVEDLERNDIRIASVVCGCTGYDLERLAEWRRVRAIRVGVQVGEEDA